MISNALRLNDNEISCGYFWKDGKEIRLGDFNISGIHAEWFAKNYTKLGFTDKEVENIARQNGVGSFARFVNKDEYVGEGDLWHNVLQLILDKGWLKIRLYEGPRLKIYYSNKDSLFDYCSINSNFDSPVEILKYKNNELVERQEFYSMGDCLDELDN